MNWFEVKVKYSMIDEKGSEKKVTEPYLVDALTFTEAEARINKEMEPYLNDEFLIMNMKRANYSDLLEDENGDKYYKCKIIFVTLDEEAGKEKKVSNYVLVQASSIETALDNLKAGFQDMTVDWDTTVIQETLIMDVFKYFEEGTEVPTHLTPIEKNKEGIKAYQESIEVIDPLFADAAALTVNNQVGSVSLLQRHFSLGYNRASRIMNALEDKGIVGPLIGITAREVLVKDISDLQDLLEGAQKLPFEEG